MLSNSKLSMHKRKTIRCLIFVAVTNLFDNLLKKDVKFGFFPGFLSDFWCFVLGANPWHDIGKKHEWLTYYVSLEFFYFGTKFFNLLDFCTPFISHPHFWGSCFLFWVPMFLDKFSLRKKNILIFDFFVILKSEIYTGINFKNNPYFAEC